MLTPEGRQVDKRCTNTAPVSNSPVPALVHHADPSEVYQPRRVAMMLKCSTGELLARAAFMYWDNLGDDALRYYAVIKGLSVGLMCLLEIETIVISPDTFRSHVAWHH